MSTASMSKSLFPEKVPPLLIVGRKEIPIVPETQKKNPNSIRLLFGTIINELFEGNIKKASAALRKMGGKYRSNAQRKEYKSFTEKSLHGILEDEDFINYWHLESAARLLEVPTGVLLIISRLMACKRSGDQAQIDALVAGMDAFAKIIVELANRPQIGKDELLAITKCFEPLLRIEPNLFETLPLASANK